MSEPGGSGLPRREARAVAPVQLSASMSGPAGAPVLVLGNSLGTTRELWDPQLDVLARLDDFEVATAYYAGVSLGGMVGMWLAANAPGRIQALALCCTSACLQPAQLW